MGAGKRWRSESEWRAILERYKASGLSQAKFCAREGIAGSSFHKWQKRIREAGAFVSLPAVIPQPGQYQLEVELPDGMIVRIR